MRSGRGDKYKYIRVKGPAHGVLGLSLSDYLADDVLAVAALGLARLPIPRNPLRPPYSLVPRHFRCLVDRRVVADVRACHFRFHGAHSPVVPSGKYRGDRALQSWYARLDDFLGRIELGTMAGNALRFLRAHTSRDHYFVLECGEIFDMDDEQGRALMAGLVNINAEIDAALARLAPTQPNFWQRVFTPTQESI